MALQSSGPISLSNIVGEFGGVAPHSLSEYYGGGTYVPAGANPGIATSGQINMGSFYDAVAATVLTISSNTNNYDIGAAAIAAGGDKSTPVILTINAGVTVGSTSTGTAAMFTGTGWSSGTTINITNNGSIVGSSGSNSSGKGAGGAGGRGRSNNNTDGTNGSAGSTASGSGQSGGNAFEHSQTANNYLSVIFDTAGTRSGGSGGTFTGSGGGGGGGGGGAVGFNMPDSDSGCLYFSGGGGGGGGNYGSGGSGGAAYGGSMPSMSGLSGASGGSTSGGAGGWTQPSYNQRGMHGGNGGSLGSAGASGEGTTSGGLNCGGYHNWGWRNYGKAGGAGGSNTSSTGSAGAALAGNTSKIS